MELKLNLGAGPNHAEGYVNLDRDAGQEAYPLPYPDNHFDEVRASHLLEHFPRNQIEPVLREWVRVLKPGGCLKIAVPNREWIFEHWHDDPLRSEMYLFGGQTDKDDFHHVSFSPAILRAWLKGLGLLDIQEWSDGVDDTHQLPVSLNLKGAKPIPPGVIRAAWDSTNEPTSVAQSTARGDDKPIRFIAVMSCPRLGWTDNFGCLYDALLPLGIPVMRHSGVFWGQGLTALIEDAIQTHKADFILTLDYDSVFSREQVERLCQLIVEHEDVDMIVPVQVRRENNYSMFRLQNDKGEALLKVPASTFQRPLTKIAYGHFGLTMMRVSAIKKMAKPWFLGTPNADGEWHGEYVDEDIHFWRQAEKAGLTVCLANEVRIGHLQNMIAWPKPDFSPHHQYFGDWHKNGQPPDAGGDLIRREP